MIMTDCRVTGMSKFEKCHRLKLDMRTPTRFALFLAVDLEALFVPDHSGLPRISFRSGRASSTGQRNREVISKLRSHCRRLKIEAPSPSPNPAAR